MNKWISNAIDGVLILGVVIIFGMLLTWRPSPVYFMFESEYLRECVVDGKALNTPICTNLVIERDHG